MSHHRETVSADGAPKAAGPYSHGVKAGGLLFLSGQTPIDPATGELVGGSPADQARRCLDNLKIVAEAAGAQLADAVRIAVYVTDISQFKAMNEVYATYFESDPPARTTIGVASLPLGAEVEMDAIIALPGLMEVTADDVRAARAAVETVARRTPMLSTRTFSERAGGIVSLKAENLQRTGSFKVRGVAAKLAALGEEGCARGVVAASAGNHAQALAAAAAARGVPCEVFVPADAPMAKVEAARGQGAIVHVGGTSVDACLLAARERSESGGLAFVHPFDDPAIVAGQGSLGLELLEDVPDLAKIVVPVGGGGLCAGIAVAVKDARPDIEIVGVQAAACSPYPESMRRGTPVEALTALTIADGIAVKRPGGIPLELISRLADGIVIVSEDETAEAMALLLERCKLVVEGAGAVGVAALLGGQVKPAAKGVTVAVLSGGNVDAGLLATIARRHETEAGRRLVMLTRVADRPGGLARLLATVAGTGANIVDVSHVREGLDLHVRETAIELVVETRGRDHAERVLGTLNEEGYPAQVLR